MIVLEMFRHQWLRCTCGKFWDERFGTTRTLLTAVKLLEKERSRTISELVLSKDTSILTGERCDGTY